MTSLHRKRWIYHVLRRLGLSLVSHSSFLIWCLTAVIFKFPTYVRSWWGPCYTFHCQSLPTGSYNSFEVQLLQLILIKPITLALIYHLPHHNKDFLCELAVLMGDLVTRHETILLLGDSMFMFAVLLNHTLQNVLI